MGKITGFLEIDNDDRDYLPVANRLKTNPKFVSALAGTLALCLLVATSPVAAKAYPANVYFHFTDGHGNDFRVPQAVPGLTECNQSKLAALAKVVQNSQPLYAGWTYVRAECKAPRR